MKTGLLIPQTYLVLMASVSFAASALTSCSKNEVSITGIAETYSTTGEATGSQLAPPVITAGMARHLGSYNTYTNTWTFNVIWTGMTDAPTGVEVRELSSPGFDANVLFTLQIMAPGKDGAAFGNIRISDAHERLLLANKLCYTVSTATRSSGEICGKFNVTAQ